MRDDTTLTIRLPKAARDQLDQLARSTQRSRSVLAAEAIAAYVAADAWQVAAIGQAVAAADAGISAYSHDDVMDYLERRAHSRTHTPRPGPVEG